LTSGLILCKPLVGVSVVDPQLHGPWYAEVTWGLENDAAWSWDAVTHADERVLEVGEVSGTALMGSE